MIDSMVFDFWDSGQSFGLFGFITRSFAVRLGFVPWSNHFPLAFYLSHFQYQQYNDQ